MSVAVRTQSEAFWQRATLLFLLLTTLLRLAFLPALELAPDEAYYWDWSRRLSLGYYDQGPMIAYVIRCTTALFGTNEFGVRIGVLLASCGTLGCCYLVAKRLYSARAGFVTVLFLALTPLMALGSQIATYDPLLVFFWALALVWLERALFGPTEGQHRAWLYAGIATGLGFLSKHTMLLLAPCVLLFLLLSPPHRFWLRRAEPYLAFACVLPIYSGVLWWNAQHHWWTFQHLLFLTAKKLGNPPRRIGDFLGSQALLLGPGLFLAAIVVSFRALRDARRQTNDTSASTSPETLFLACVGLPVFLFFCMMTLKAKVQGNWAPCAWLTPTILLAGQLTLRAERTGQAARQATRQIALVAALSGLMTLLVLSPTLRMVAGIRLSPDTDVSNEAYGWRETAAHVQAVRQEMERGGHRVFVAANGYQYAALMAFYLPDRPETYCLFLHFRLSMYAAFVARLQNHLGDDAVYVNNNEVEDPYLRQIFTRVEWDPPIPIWRRPFYSEPIRTLHIARCYGFRRYVGLDWAEGG